MNGAQVASLVEIIKNVSGNQLPASVGSRVIAAAFPTLDSATVEAMMREAEAFTPPVVP